MATNAERLRCVRTRAARRFAERLEPPPTAERLRARVDGRWDEIGRLDFEDLGDWGHARGQQMARFTRR